MLGKGFELFKLFGFSVRVDASWLLIAALIVWSLAAGLFPAYYPDLSARAYWWMAICGALGLFASIVVHEFAHALVARQRGLEMRGITLFIFGGVAEMDDEPTQPGTEFLVAIAGPLTSVAVAVASYGLWRSSLWLGWPTPVGAVFWYMSLINAVLVVFNLIPAFPLDGGRVFRSLLWWWSGSLRTATRIASNVGSGFGVVLILLGVLTVFAGSFLSGLWWVLLGLFLRSAAAGSYQQMLIRRALQGEPIERFVQPNVKTVPSSTSVQHFVDDYVYRYHYKMFPVVGDGGDRLVGCATTGHLKEIPHQQWQSLAVAEIAEPCSESNTIAPEADALAVLAKMSRGDVSRLMVVKDGHLLGIISLKDMMRLISMRLELEDGEENA